MDDRELLELAAKAAGIRHIQPTNDYDGSLGLILCDEYNWPGRDWSPLTDDGDALRLAVKLMLSVTIGPCQVQAVSISGALRGEFPKEDAIYQDMGIATRRAIVRAAAEIGRGME